MTIQEEIRNLAQARKAVILAHNYTRGEVQDVADYTGDSLELARQAGAVPVSLGRRILRAETAGLVAISAIFYETGDLGD